MPVEKNSKHWAVVVGIDRYPGFKGRDLICPSRDADAFRAWLLDPAGGNVPETNILPVSGKLPKKMTSSNARPTERAIHEAIQKAYQNAYAAVLENAAAWNDTRLYLFFSGHGIALTRDDASLLGADADDTNPGKHVSCSALKEFFEEQPYFRELVVFADCCRDDFRAKLKTFNFPTWSRGQEVGDGSPDIFFLCAADFGAKAFEEQKGPQEERSSYFTRCLLDALHGDAASGKTVDAGDVVKRMNGLYAHLQEAEAPIGKMRPFMTNPGMRFGVTGKTPKYRTELTVTDVSHVRVRGNEDYIPLVPNGTPGVFSAHLLAGKYQVELAGTDKKYSNHPDWLTVLPGYNEKRYERI